MEAGRRGWFGAWMGLVVLLPGLLVGCTASRARIDKALKKQQSPPARATDCAARYLVHCPDVLEIEVVSRSRWKGRKTVDVDGAIDLDGEPLRVEGLAPPQIARELAQRAGVPSDWAHVKVVEYNSKQLFLLGEVTGLERAVAYQGPERVLELLRRVGGITPDASLHNIRVVRAHVADGKPPEVFPINLAAIVADNNHESNIILQPFDRIYIAPSRRSVVACCIPPWLRALCKLGIHVFQPAPPPDPLP